MNHQENAMIIIYIVVRDILLIINDAELLYCTITLTIYFLSPIKNSFPMLGIILSLRYYFSGT